MKNLLIVLLILFGVNLNLGYSGICQKNSRCVCLDLQNEYEFQCPKTNDYNVVLHITKKKAIVECMENFQQFNLKIFPNYTASDVEFLNMKFCPLPEAGFQPLLQKFGIHKLTKFRFEISENSSAKEITNDFFKGMSSLKDLTIDSGNNSFNENFLQYLPNLTSLDLGRSNLKEIGYIFKYSSNLQQLYLTQASIKEIPDRLFENLTNLQRLHLWQNQLTVLKKESFVGLKNLRSLELSSNNIQFIEPYTFSELPLLVNMSFFSNNLGYLGPDIFSNHSKLKNIRIDRQSDLTLADKSFAYLTDLTTLSIGNSKLQTIPDNIFEGSTNIEILSLEQNLLSNLSVKIFRDMKKLKSLYLNSNKIISLPEGIFLNTDHLEILDLSFNSLIAISENTFNGNSLKTLFLNDNNISEISQVAFIHVDQLNHLDISNNKITLNTNINIFSHCTDLQILDLHGNQISEFPSEILYMDKLENLNLSENLIEGINIFELLAVSKLKVDLKFNKISVINFDNAKVIPNESDILITQVDLQHNAIICDCRNYGFIQYLNGYFPTVYNRVDLQIGESKCAEPESFEHIRIRDLKPQHISCTYMKDGCPEGCDCFERPFDDTVVVKCDNRNLTNWPDISFEENKIELDLTGNKLTRGPNVSQQNNNITNLYLSNNALVNIDWIPANIQILKLDGNNLKHIKSSLLQQLVNSSSFKNISLKNNAWDCSCDGFDLYNFIVDNNEKVSERSNILCDEDQKPLMHRKNMCPYPHHLLQIILPITIICFIILVLITLYAYYRQEIKIWLYAHNWCLWFVTEEDLDQDMEYDIFLSYSHKDEDFVIQNLLPMLEGDHNPYKICIHVRDFIGGDLIVNHVTDSVLNSKRTLVVLSNSFLESSWGKYEFRTAHNQSIEEGRTRLVVIKYGDLNEDQLDDDIKTYLKTNTYVEWGKPWFWNKLKYALPHTRIKTSQKIDQKHANMMLKIDEKFRFVSPPISPPESTPPLMVVHPPLMKNQQLSYGKLDVESPPTEAPTIIA